MATNKEHNENKERLLKLALPVGTVLKGEGALHEYKVVDVLGAGGFGITYKVSTLIKVGNVTTKMFFVIKEFFLKGCERDKKDKKTVSCAESIVEEFKDSLEKFKTEAERLSKLANLSPNIVKVNEHFKANNTMYYVMEFLDGSNLEKMVESEGPLSEARAISIIEPIAHAVELLHEDHVLHLDIKPDNIVMKTDASTGMMTPVLIDFGISMHFDKKGHPTSSLVEHATTDGYAPIEQYTEITMFSPEIDIYALGATLYFLLTGKSPLKAFYESTERIVKTLPPEISARTEKVIRESMQKGPAERTKTARMFLETLEEPVTLTTGTILLGKTTNFMITEVIKQENGYILYKAVPTSSDKSQAKDETTLHVTGGKTVALQEYYVYEFFSKGIDKRDDDMNRRARIYNTADYEARWLSQIKDIINRDDLVGGLSLPIGIIQERCELLLDDNNKVKSELIHANNTLYLVCAIRKKPSVWVIITNYISSVGNAAGSCAKHISSVIAHTCSGIARNKKKNAAVVIVFAIAATCYLSVKWYQNRPKPAIAEQKDSVEIPTKPVSADSDSVPKPTPPKPEDNKTQSERLKEASSINDFLALANENYAPAFYPLASKYYSADNKAAAKNWANKSISANVNVSQARSLISKIESEEKKKKKERGKDNPVQIQSADDIVFENAKSIIDYRVLANKGYKKAYAKLAQMELSAGNYDEAARRANQAISAGVGVSAARSVKSRLAQMGY